MSQDQPQPSSDSIQPGLLESESPGSELLKSELPGFESSGSKRSESELPKSEESEFPESELPDSSESPATPVDTAQPSIEASRAVPVSPRSPSARSKLPENDEILPQTLMRLVGEAVVAAQPVVKQQSIKALRGTIHLLETAIERLEAAPAPKEKVPAPETAAENVLPPHSKPNTGKLAPTLSTAALQEKFQTVWRSLRRSWRSLLRQLRDRLPASIHRNLSDRALTGAIVGMVAIVIWATGALTDRPTPATVTEAPPTVTVAPSPEPTPAPKPVPPIVQAPATPKPVEISPPPIQPLPPSPPLKLTPEQTLIARIQDQVAGISNQYASGLVQSVQANFRGSRLIVNISDGWYGLSRSQQEKLAGELLRRSQTLDFSKLELVDGVGALLARSPIVGDEMVLLKRTQASAA